MTINFSTQFDKEVTYQEEFPAEEWCGICAAPMFPIVQIADDSGEIANHRPPQTVHWMHDACVIVVYQCHKCMEMKAVYNQG